MQERTNELEELKNRLAFERAARAESLAAAESRAGELERQLRESQQRNESLMAENRDAIESFKQAQLEVERLDEEIEAVRNDIRQTRADRDAQLAMAVELRDRLNQEEGSLRRLEERHQELLAQLSQAQLVLDRNDLSINEPIDGQPPQVDGIITAIRGDQLVEVSVGADEGLRRGHTLEVYRDSGGYLGRLVVIETNPDRSVTRIVPEYRQGIMRKGDRVATKLL